VGAEAQPDKPSADYFFWSFRSFCSNDFLFVASSGFKTASKTYCYRSKTGVPKQGFWDSYTQFICISIHNPRVAGEYLVPTFWKCLAVAISFDPLDPILSS
jgi:hypothetical protein